jgi:prepilin-type N-terminal cleavage/methylation domain-containing protein
MSPQRARAFTLIELLVVILIIAFISAVIVPAFAGFYEKTRFDAEIRRVEDYFALAREKAVKGDTTVTLHFEAGIHQFSMVTETLPPQNDLPTAMLNDAGNDGSQGQDPAPYQIGADYQVENFHALGAGAGMNGPATTQSDVRFLGDGTCDRADLTMVSRRGYTAQLTLSSMDGRLTLDTQTGQP